MAPITGFDTYAQLGNIGLYESVPGIVLGEKQQPNDADPSPVDLGDETEVASIGYQPRIVLELGSPRTSAGEKRGVSQFRLSTVAS